MRSLPSRFAFALAGALLALPAAAAQADALPGTTSQSFTTQGCGSTFVAPAGVTQVTVKATGANGGGGLGGKSAVVTGSLAVTPGASYTVCVNVGGGIGGQPMNQFGNLLYPGSDGGGYSSLSAGGTQYVLAGGGGGAGGLGVLSSAGAGGGSASYPPSTAATAGTDSQGMSGAMIGNPASGVGPGSGGTGYNPVNNSVSGSALAGGAGGNGGQAGYVADGTGGGGGGAGYFGGGGGAGGHSYAAVRGAGGGGGSSYCDGAVTCTGTVNTAQVASVLVTYATAPVLDLTPAAVDFGSVTPGQTSSEQTVTFKNTGTGAFTGGSLELTGADAAAFKMTGTTCTGTSLAPETSCTIQFTFTPTRTGAHSATLAFTSVSAGNLSVTFTGSGAAAAAPPAPTPTATPTPPTSTDDGAALSPKAGGKAAVSKVDNTVSLPLTCPDGDVCKVDGDLKLRAGDIEGRKLLAVAAAAKVQVLARFKDVSVKGGEVRTLKLELPKSFIRAAQKAGKRRMTATLTINTTFGSGRTVTRTQKIVLLIPIAAKKKAAAAKPKFTG